MMSILINSLAGGGAERVAVTLLAEFAKKGTDVELICLERDQTIQDLPMGIEVSYLTGFGAVKNPIVKFTFLIICAYRLKKRVKARGITVVQSHLIRANYVNTLARILGSSHRCQIVNHMMVSYDKKRGVLGRVTRFLYKLLYAKADMIVSISELMRRDLDRLIGGHAHHEVIPNPHDIRAIQSKSLGAAERFDFATTKNYIIYAGRLVARKRLDLLITAYSEIKKTIDSSVDLLILGDGVKLEDCREQVRRLGLSDAVHFLGHVDNPYPYIARSTVLILASDDEGLPNIIVESLACGTPVISSDCKSGPREILAPETDVDSQLAEGLEVTDFGILFPVDRADCLAKALASVLTDRDLQMELSSRGTLRARDFSSERIAARYLASLNAGAFKATERDHAHV